jgi:hypothetical protein
MSAKHRREMNLEMLPLLLVVALIALLGATAELLGAESRNMERSNSDARS